VNNCKSLHVVAVRVAQAERKTVPFPSLLMQGVMENMEQLKKYPQQ